MRQSISVLITFNFKVRFNYKSSVEPQNATIFGSILCILPTQYMYATREHIVSVGFTLCSRVAYCVGFVHMFFNWSFGDTQYAPPEKILRFSSTSRDEKSCCRQLGHTHSRSNSRSLYRASKFSRSQYLDNHLSESIHTWTINALYDWLSFHKLDPRVHARGWD